MVSCLSTTPDTVSRRNPTPYPIPITSSPPKFSSQEAIAFLRQCADFRQMRQIHGRVIRTGLSADQPVVSNLLRLCSAYGKLDYANLVFDQIQSPPTFIWNLMIRAHAMNGSSRQALLFYNLMICRGVPPDKFTFPFVIKACVDSSLIGKGKEVQTLAIKTGFYFDLYFQNTLMDFYLKVGDLDSGQKVFDKMQVRNIVSWTTMISGLASSSQLDAARHLFDQMPTRNVVSYTALINGYARNKFLQESFELFRKMQIDNIKPNDYTLVSLLIASTELGSLELGRLIHEFALKNGFEIGVFIGTALIDMYSKCGSLDDAKQVFDKMPVRSLATWNSMITSLGVHGCGEEAIELFLEMEKENVRPDSITFIGVLCACLHTKNVEKGVWYFNYMREVYGIEPIEEHYDCMFEFFRRTKMLDQSSEFVRWRTERK